MPGPEPIPPGRRAGYPSGVTIELTLLPRVAYRGREVTSPRLRGLLALLAGDLRTGCSTARKIVTPGTARVISRSRSSAG